MQLSKAVAYAVLTQAIMGINTLPEMQCKLSEFVNHAQDWAEAPDLAKWVGRQRVARAQGGLSEERLQVLYAMGFEFGEVAQLTDEWEAKFDQLIEWIQWQVHACSIWRH